MAPAVPFERFSEKTKKILTLAQDEAASEKVPYIGTEHILLALLRFPDCGANKALAFLGIDYDKARSTLANLPPNARVNIAPLTPSEAVKKVIGLAVEEMNRLEHPNVGTGHLLIGLLLYTEGRAAQALTALGVTLESARAACSQNQEEKQLVSTIGDDRRAPRPGGPNHYLKLYTRDLNALAKAGKLDPVIGRDEEINKICRILLRRTKNNPVLLGDPGVGKTVLPEGLAQRIVQGKVADSLKKRRVLVLDMTAVVAGCRYRGDFEERIKNILDEANADREPDGSPRVILFIDELHVLVGAGSAEGSLDAANILKPALAKGEVQVIGATTLREYRHIEKDAALERRFQPVIVKAPSVIQAERILEGIKHLYEAHHRVTITAGAIHAAPTLSDRYITDRALPDKAIDVVDEAAAKVRLLADELPSQLEALQASIANLAAERQKLEAMDIVPIITLEKVIKEQAEAQEKLAKCEAFRLALQIDPLPQVTEDDIAEVIANRTDPPVPIAQMTRSEQLRFSQMEQILSKLVVGQPEAISIVSKAVRKQRAGLNEPGLPIASFIFVGGTGIGKTELARALAQFLFDDPDAMTRLDMSEFGEKHLVARLIGSPPGYVGSDEGGQLTEAVRRRPFSVILLDEIEKAHPDVFNLLLQIQGSGRLSDAKGKIVNFANTVIICTSNLGTEIMSGADLGFQAATDPAVIAKRTRKAARKRIDQELKKTFRPEFLNRQSAIVVFQALGEEQILQIADMKLTSIINRASEQRIRLVINEAARKQLSKECARDEEEYDEEQQVGTITNSKDGFQYGARPMQRLVEARIKDPLAEQIVLGAIKPGDTVVIDYGDLGYSMDVQQPVPAPVLATV